MGSNDDARRREAMRRVDNKLKEYREKYGCSKASKLTSEAYEEVSEETYYDAKTLARYHNQWINKKGIFSHLG